MEPELPEEPFDDRDPDSPIETVIQPRIRDLGDGFQVRRALPSTRRRSVGPFVFLDQTLDVDPDHAERAAYVAEGEVAIDRCRFPAGRLVIFRPGQRVRVHAQGPARLLLVAGAPPDGPRHVWWNLVSSSREKIERAKADWASGAFPRVPGETEFIPLPGHEAGVAKSP